MIDWSYLNDFTDIGEAVSSFNHSLDAVIRYLVPQCKASNRNFPPRFNGGIIRLVKLKECYLKRWRGIRTDICPQEIRRPRRLEKIQIKSASTAESRKTCNLKVPNDSQIFGGTVLRSLGFRVSLTSIKLKE
ncbi:hypothetical protein Trydic_g40 [Trypoxylus dichotomus]